MTAPKYTITLSRERVRQFRKNARGLCSVASCDCRVHRGGKCVAHYAKDLARLKAAYAKKKEEM